MDKYNILIAEDDKEIARSIGIYLKNENFNIFYAYDGLEALDIFKNEKIDLIIMDLMMPNLSGEEAIIKLREISVVPIIILSAKSEDTDKIFGLNIGADDYIQKPFNPMELIARVKSNLRRFYAYDLKNDRNFIEIGSIKLDLSQKIAYVEDEPVALTSIEFKILELLMRNPNRVFSIEEIYESVWNEPAMETKTVTVHIRRIREKIEVNPKKPMYLKVQWGLGYKFEDLRRK
ncbi:MAG: response regulator transcription factor [Peptoniphilus grossensis]|uniref:response regulator transcription factor n=1 Tax=Peptoniphilus grossensis TaxID=1465756 RepID=UPI00258ADFCC|nr:response regulator transcription factor [Peptoniphilus grossensis]MDU5100451.1 response regulator transcription factor [Peptoniphilus grossensis]